MPSGALNLKVAAAGVERGVAAGSTLAVVDAEVAAAIGEGAATAAAAVAGTAVFSEVAAVVGDATVLLSSVVSSVVCLDSQQPMFVRRLTLVVE